MRALVARHYGGTPFDDKYLSMPSERLYILWAEARREVSKSLEKEFKQAKFMDTLARFVSMIANPEVYKKFVEIEKLDEFREEFTPEQAVEDFKAIKKMGLEFLEVIQTEQAEEALPQADPELERFFENEGFSGFQRELQELVDKEAPLTVRVDASELIEEEGDE